MARKVARTSSWSVRVLTTPTPILPRNDERASYDIINEHAALAIFVKSGTSGGVHVTVAGEHRGQRIGPNGGDIYDDKDVDCVYAVSTAINNEVTIVETVYGGISVRDSEK